MIVSWLVNLYDKYGHGVKYSDLTGKLQQLIVGILSFMNVCNLSNTGDKYNTVGDILSRTQHYSQL